MADIHQCDIILKETLRNIPRSPETRKHEEGVIDLRPGTDYSRCPDVFQYLQIVGEFSAEEAGEETPEDPMELAETGRRHLEKRMSNGTGIFVPPKNYLSHPPLTRAPGRGPRYKPSKPAGPIRYDKATATQQPPFRADTWIDLLTAHLKRIGDAARVRLEEDYYKPGISFAPLDQVSVDEETLITNIRAPIPHFRGDPPSPHTPEYKELIVCLYHTGFNPIGLALKVPGFSPASISTIIDSRIAGEGFSTADRDEGVPRFKEAWSRWDEEAELRYVRKRHPERYAAWEKLREDYERDRAAGKSLKVQYSAEEAYEYCLRRSKEWCIHDEPIDH
ncbi:hypothetical protein IAT38_002313 [Cryptococcus sp. DSM 104549]